ncbi:MAG: UDP-glucose 4-epimerase GalE, partial [Bryobacteraceae bacterium]
MSVLITGGAGYIGSHMAFSCLETGRDVVVIDNLITGLRALVPEQAHFIQGDIADQAVVRTAIRNHSVTAVIHFAGSAIVPDSVAEPLTYYANNTSASRNLIEACVQEGVQNFIFSSTAAVYGIPQHSPASEDAVKAPINPYGRSKLVTEWILEDACRAHGLHSLALRYFNVAGADPRGRTGQSTPRATHLIKRASQAALDRIPVLDIFGTDFPTHDGTGVRDYIHVSDLVTAHLLGLEHLEKGGASLVMNCGYGHGFSVREIISTVEKVAGRKIPTREAPPRPGDPAELVADSTRLKSLLGWQPRYDDIEEIAATAYRWEKRLNA